MRKYVGWILNVGVVTAVGLGAWACDAGEVVGDVMVDAASAIRDAGEALQDGASIDASAQVPDRVEQLNCDVEHIRRVTQANGNYTEQSQTFAELRDPSIDPDSILAVRTLLCGFEHQGYFDSQPCPDGSTCTGETNVSRAPLSCRVATLAEIEPGLIRVRCGNWNRSSRDGAVTEIGLRATTVRVTLVQ